MKKLTIALMLCVLVSKLFSQVEISIDSTITEVQPMTGIVLWQTSGSNSTDAISLEYSYMSFDNVIEDSASYNWTYVENKLDDIASRGHQAILRFRYIYPGRETTIPQYILDRADYTELIDKSEGLDTHFADWTCEELKRFTIEFYKKFGERYDNDPRLAFVQVGFGLWAEYHIYEGPKVIGEQFPDKDFQEDYFDSLSIFFKETPWSISIDAASSYYSPFSAKPELKNIKFGLFDDSFMSKDHAGYNTESWEFFDLERYKTSPAGGEFNYYTKYDQQHVLDYPAGNYGLPYEYYADEFHISYMIGNDQPGYQNMDRIKDASMASGYKFKIVSLTTTSESAVFEIMNYGVAPFYYDAYIAVDGVRSTESLKLLAPGETKTFTVAADAEGAVVTIECDRLVTGQKIQYYGTQALPEKPVYTPIIPTPPIAAIDNVSKESKLLIYPTFLEKNDFLYIDGNVDNKSIQYSIYNVLGELKYSSRSNQNLVGIPITNLSNGIHFLLVEIGDKTYTKKIIIL